MGSQLQHMYRCNGHMGEAYPSYSPPLSILAVVKQQVGVRKHLCGQVRRKLLHVGQAIVQERAKDLWWLVCEWWLHQTGHLEHPRRSMVVAGLGAVDVAFVGEEFESSCPGVRVSLSYDWDQSTRLIRKRRDELELIQQLVL